MNARVHVTHTPEQTAALGGALAPSLVDGDLLALSGELGAGKTRFVTGLARGLACRARVRSPSFAIVNEYHGRLLLSHLDLYRLDTPDVDGLGLDEYLERGAVVVEWGERLPRHELAEALQIHFVADGDTTRRLDARAEGGRGLVLLDAWSRLSTDADVTRETR